MVTLNLDSTKHSIKKRDEQEGRNGERRETAGCKPTCVLYGKNDPEAFVFSYSGKGKKLRVFSQESKWEKIFYSSTKSGFRCFLSKNIPQLSFSDYPSNPYEFFYLKNVYFQKKKISIRETKNF
jgi:hypothetical protein